MRDYHFTIIASGLDPSAPDFEDRLFEAGCGDATVAFMKGAIVLDFDRQAKNFAHALISAIEDVRRAGATVRRVEPDYLVSTADIARRVGMTRTIISLYSQGKRGRDFPRPIARLTSDSPLWDWAEVARWMFHHGHIDRHANIQAQMLKAANMVFLKVQDHSEITPIGAVLQAKMPKEAEMEDA